MNLAIGINETFIDLVLPSDCALGKRLAETGELYGRNVLRSIKAYEVRVDADRNLMLRRIC